MANEATKLTIGGVQHDIKDAEARRLIALLQAALDAMTGTDTTTAIETFQEVLDFLAGVTDDETLVGKITALQTAINGKVDKETGKGLSTNDYTTEDKTKLAGLPTNPVQSISVNGQTQQKDTNGNVNVEVQAGDQVSVIQPDPADGTFTIRVGSDDYTVNLNHTHENMAKLRIVDEEPSDPERDTIYALVDDADNPSEIEVLYIAGVEFAGGGAPAGTPVITRPSGTTLNIGTNDGSGVSAQVEIKGRNLTGDLTVTVGTGLTVTYNGTTASSVTIPLANALAGAQVTIAYSGSGALDDGSLVITGGGASPKSVVVVVVVVVDYYSGIEYNKKAGVNGTAGNFSESISTDSTKCITPIYDLDGGGHVIKIRFGYTGQLIGLNGYDSSDNFIELWVASANERTVTLYNNVTKVRATLQKADLDNCYIYDVTAAKWLFKGNNVTQIPT